MLATLVLPLAAFLFFPVQPPGGSGRSESTAHGFQKSAISSSPKEQLPVMTEREQAGLRGLVKTCIQETTFPSHAANNIPERKMSTTTDYDLSGRVLAVRHSNPDGSEWISTKTYDSSGRLVKVSSGSTNSKAAEQLYTYDESGKLLRISYSNSESTDTTFRYDEQGRKSKIEKFPTLPQTGGLRAATAYAWEGSETGFNVPEGATITTLYNERDQPIEAQIHNAEGQLVSRIVRGYDKKARHESDQQIIENSDLILPPEMKSQMNAAQLKSIGTFMAAAFVPSISYSYDANDRISEKRSGMGSLHEQTTSVSYNEHGDVAEERTTTSSHPDLSKEFSLGEDGEMISTDNQPVIQPTQSETRYEYQYDSHGNWTEQSVLFRHSADDSFKVSTTYKRKITYY
jgi:YD repeat-containing protein